MHDEYYIQEERGRKMRYRIIGNIVPAVECRLNKGEEIYTQSGGMSWMSEAIEYKSNIRGGILNGIGRIFRGESMFVTAYKSKIDDGMITFASNLPGSIKEFMITPEKDFICQKAAFLCAQSAVKSKICFSKKISAGLFGGEGLVLQRLYGSGIVFLEICGDACTFQLKDKESILVDSGCIVGFESTVDFDVRLVKGVKNMFFGGEGMFLSRLEGPGMICLQTQNIQEFSSRLQKNMVIQ